MPTFFNVTIPVKRYIKKYLHARFGDVLQAKASTPLGDIVLTKLADHRASKLGKADMNFRLKSFNDSVRIQIPFDYFYSIGKRPDNVHAFIRINQFFENQFREDLHQFVNAATSSGLQLKEAIEKFAELRNIDIEHDITYDCLKKMEYRDRIAVKAVSKSGTLDRVPYDLTTLSNLYRHQKVGTPPNQTSLF